MRAGSVALLAVLAVLPCCIFANGMPPEADVNVQLASQYNFRGQVMTEYPVLQADGSMRLPTVDGGIAILRAFGNLDLTDHTGDAWMASGSDGEFTEIDLQASYARQVQGVDLSAGVVHYSWAEGERFPFTRFPPTTEVFARIGGRLGPVQPALAAFYDLDVAGGFYVRAELGHSVEVRQHLHLDLLVWQGMSDADHSLWLYRTHEDAFADLGAAVTLRWDLDDVTHLRLGVAGSSIVDGDLRDWFETRTEPDNVWFTLGVGWRL